MEKNLKHIALITGIVLLVASMIFSFQGFNFNFTGTNDFWTVVFWIIGTGLTASVSVMEMIFNTDYSNLNKTLKLFGILSYVYSIYTNHAGLKPFVNIEGSDFTTWVIAVALDILPEPMIAWSLGESLKGDFVGNFLKWLMPGSQSARNEQRQGQKQHKHIPNSAPRVFNKDMFDHLPKTPKDHESV